VSALWVNRGELGAMLHVLKLLWQQYLQHHGLDDSDCWVTGLLTRDGGGGGSSSSNSAPGGMPANQ
jgi:hypothetical protein